MRTLASAGADVAIHYHRNETKARELVAELTAMGRRAVAVQADVTVQADVERMRDEVTAALGAPQIIVNNAVIQYKWVSILDQDLRADALRVAASRQVLQGTTWVEAPVQAATVQKLEDIILTKARELRRQAVSG